VNQLVYALSDTVWRRPVLGRARSSRFFWAASFDSRERVVQLAAITSRERSCQVVEGLIDDEPLVYLKPPPRGHTKYPDRCVA